MGQSNVVSNLKVLETRKGKKLRSVVEFNRFLQAFQNNCCYYITMYMSMWPKSENRVCYGSFWYLSHQDFEFAITTICANDEVRINEQTIMSYTYCIIACTSCTCPTLTRPGHVGKVSSQHREDLITVFTYMYVHLLTLHTSWPIPLI